MRIAVDATPVSDRVTGAARVLLNLLRTFPSVAPDLEFVALATPEGARRIEGVDARRVELGSSRNWERDGVAEAAAAAGADLLFTVREVAPRHGLPAVVHLFEPPAYRLRVRRPTRAQAKDLLLHLGLRATVERAAAVTAGSEATAAWLGRSCGIEAPVVLPALEDRFRAEPAKDRGSYFFSLFTGDQRECVDLVLDGFREASLEGVELRVGGMGERQRRRLAPRLDGQPVELLGWVTDDELVSLYRRALAFVHPTRYEAYAGLPVLEAMGLGTPVVALRAPGVTEAVEGAGILLEREDAGELGAVLDRLAADEDGRDDLARRGAARVAGLRWEVSAAAFVRVFRRVLDA